MILPLTDWVFVLSASVLTLVLVDRWEGREGKKIENSIAITHEVVSRHKCINKSHSSTWSCHLDADADDDAAAAVAAAATASSSFNDLFAVRLYKDTKHTVGSLYACVGRNESFHANRYNSIRFTWIIQVGSFLTSFPHAQNRNHWIELDTCFHFMSVAFQFRCYFYGFSTLKRIHTICFFFCPSLSDMCHMRRGRIHKSFNFCPVYASRYFIWYSHQSNVFFFFYIVCYSFKCFYFRLPVFIHNNMFMTFSIMSLWSFGIFLLSSHANTHFVEMWRRKLKLFLRKILTWFDMLMINS